MEIAFPFRGKSRPVFCHPLHGACLYPGTAARGHPAGALKRLFKLVQGIKASPDDDEGIGLQFGIVGNLHHAESDVPTFKLRLTRGDASCEWVKGTFSRFGNESVYVEGRRGGGDWETLSRSGCFTGASFVDKRPLLDPKRPEVREYRLCFWENSVPQGNWTEVKSLTVSP